MKMQKICFVNGPGGGHLCKNRLNGPQRLTEELKKRIKGKFRVTQVSTAEGRSKILNTIFEIKKRNPDIIHGHGSLNMGLFLIVAKLLLRKKTIITYTDFKPNIIKNGKILNLLDSVIVQTEYGKKKLISMGVKPKKITVITYGVEEKFKSGKACKDIRKIGKNLFLYFGDARIIRGFGLIMKALPLINKNKSILLCIRGFEGEKTKRRKDFFEQDVRNFIKKYPNVTLLTLDQYPCSIADIIASVDGIILPYLGNTLEPPLTLMEALTSGKPVITTDIGGNKEVTTKDTIILKENDAFHLAECINKSKKRKHLKATYPWSKVISSVTKIYQS